MERLFLGGAGVCFIDWPLAVLIPDIVLWCLPSPCPWLLRTSFPVLSGSLCTRELMGRKCPRRRISCQSTSGWRTCAREQSTRPRASSLDRYLMSRISAIEVFPDLSEPFCWKVSVCLSRNFPLASFRSGSALRTQLASWGCISARAWLACTPHACRH